MTGRDLIIYILTNNLENEFVFKDGKFIGSKPCYGYMRDPEDKGHLIPNPETAPIVKSIFKWRVEGVGPTEIATRLNNDGVPTPSGYKNTKFSSRLIDRDTWTISTIKKILTNKIYTGDKLTKEMFEYARKYEFEKAAVLRDLINELKNS